ncbi:MAG: TetR family transcriptional regulator [Planctomycetota bacterium]
MPRKYDASRRRASAQETRRRILDAAVRLHGQGVTAYEPLASAAGVSLATVRKHFPSREHLFQGCTSHFLANLQLPDFAAVARVRDAGQRLIRVVELVCALLDAAHDLVWHSAPFTDSSTALSTAAAQLSTLLDEATAALVDGPGLGLRASSRAAVRKRVRALLDPLTYRAFRTVAGFERVDIERELGVLLRCAVGLTST